MAEIAEIADVLEQKHPAQTDLLRFGGGELSRRENHAIVRHLLSGCAACRRITRRLLPQAEAAPPERFDYSRAFAAVRRELVRRQVAFANEQADTPALFDELASLPFDQQWLRVTREDRFQTWSLCERLLDASRDWGFQDPGHALELAELGSAVAARLSRVYYGEARVNDLAARAWATLANALRIRSDFRAAENGFSRAERLLREGTGDPLEKARVLLLKASLRGNQGRHREALRLLDQAAHIAGKSGDLHLVGKARIAKGFVNGVAGRPEEAIALLAQGLQQIEVALEPRLLVAARHNLGLYLSESGRQREALDVLAETRPLYLALGDRMNLMRLSWVEGKIALELGELARAEALLQEVRQELVSRGIGYDAALVSLDLAALYARQGRTTEMRQLAREIVPIFQSRDLEREVLTALLVFEKAAEMDRVTLDLVQGLREYLAERRDADGLPGSSR